MAVLKRIFDFYIRSSIHVALAVYALVKMTQHMFGISGDGTMALFAFFGTVAGYNFVKYDEIARVRRKNVRQEIKAFALLSGMCFLGSAYCFFQLQRITQIVTVIFLALTVLYTLPFFPNRRNARNWAGAKIYIVALCWMGVTVVLPVINAGIAIDSDFYLKCLQRFILVFVLILIFDIIDLAKDDPHLKTVPQNIGVRPTKILGLVLLIVFYFLEFLKTGRDIRQIYINIVLVVVAGLFLVFANTKRSKYYSSFWAESIPMLWFALILLFG